MPLKTIDDLVPILRVKPVTIRHFVARGELPYIKVGRRYCFTDEHIKIFMSRNERNAKTAGAYEAAQ